MACECAALLKPLVWSRFPAFQAGVLLALASPVVCVLTVLRFRSADLRFPMLFATLVFALSGAQLFDPQVCWICSNDASSALISTWGCLD